MSPGLSGLNTQIVFHMSADTREFQEGMERAREALHRAFAIWRTEEGEMARRLLRDLDSLEEKLRPEGK